MTHGGTFFFHQTTPGQPPPPPQRPSPARVGDDLIYSRRALHLLLLLPPFSLPSLQPPNENKMTTLYQTQPGWHRNFPLIGRGQSKTDRHKIRCVYGLHMIHVSTSAATNILGFPKPEVMNQVFCPTKIKTSTYSILNDPMKNWEILTFVKLELECLTFIF